MTLSEELKWRGFVNQTTFDDIRRLDGEPITFYWGVDPSAKSMHIGQLAMTIMIRHFVRAGHRPVLLVGGATGLIGDPDGKDAERELRSLEEISDNKVGIRKQYENLFEGVEIQIVDNYEWFSSIGYIEFLRDVGKHMPMSQMLGREFIKSRLGESGSGISYAEFSYALIQGYDFLHLYRNNGVTLQVCGSDQWGNSIAGVDLIRRIDDGEAHVWSAPLIINKTTGKKFGKTESGTVWLDANLTSPYQFYQFWINSDDQGVEDYLKIYTELSLQEIDKIINEHSQNPSERKAQKRLAFDVTRLVHGGERARSVEKVSNVLFGDSDYTQLGSDDIAQLESELLFLQKNNGVAVIDCLVEADLAMSRTEARRFLQDGAIYINGQQVNNQESQLEPDLAIDGYVIIRRGKNAMCLVKIA